MRLWNRLKKSWHGLVRGRPGHRFQQRHERAKAARGTSRFGWARRIASIVLGLAAVAVGIVEIVFPGPAVAFFFVGGALLANESMLVARLMDWAEVKGRIVFAWGRDLWRHASAALRGLIVASATTAGAAGVYFGYWLIRD
jgi:hypothetical protein